MTYTTKTFAVAVITLAVALPSIASAQLTYRERAKAQEYARIQAKADAAERAKELRIHRDAAQAECSGSQRQWDYANETCKPLSLLKPR